MVLILGFQKSYHREHLTSFLSNLKTFFYKNGPSPASFSFIFGPPQTNIDIIFTTNQCEKSPSNIWRRDSNPWPLERESPPITTRPGLPPFLRLLDFQNSFGLHHDKNPVNCQISNPKQTFVLCIQSVRPVDSFKISYKKQN